MAGLYVAIERFMQHDHEADYRAHLDQATLIHNALKDRADLQTELIADPEAYPAPCVFISPERGAHWTAEGLGESLQAGEPSIHARVEHGRLEINTHCLMPGDPEQIAESISSVLDWWGKQA
jgi:L-seryl-tRNA(Ser) seleniumtransferase